MERYSVWEGFMGDLRKKVASIQKKCNKFGCEFHFAEVGEEIREVPDYTRKNPLTGKEPLMVACKFIICEAEGKAVVNGWEFVASVEHTEKGNIFHKAPTAIQIPERYRTSDTYCEHCNSHRHRKGTFLVVNTETGEFKQVGNNCLMDFTHGMSASYAAYMASLKTIFQEAEEKPVGGCWGWGHRYYETEEFLRYTAETIKHFGFSKSNDSTSTKSRVMDFFNVAHGNTRYWEQKEIDRVRDLMDQVGFNPESDEAKEMVEKALTWISNQEATNDYMHNLKVVTSLDYTDEGKFGLLVSLFPTWDRELEKEAQRKAEAERGAASEFVGKIGDRVTVEIEAVKCITSWESCYNGYSTTTTYVWKIVGKDGNVYTWKTSTYMSEDNPPVSLKGTVKEHKIYREVKQTELTRCKVERRVA
jgi:hypothetical protein